MYSVAHSVSCGSRMRLSPRTGRESGSSAAAESRPSGDRDGRMHGSLDRMGESSSIFAARVSASLEVGCVRT